MLDKDNQNRLVPQSQLNQDLEAFYSYLINLGDSSHDDLDFQFRLMGHEVAIASLKNDCRGLTRDDVEKVANNSFLRGILACFCYYRDGRPAISKLLERQALDIDEADISMYQERRLLSAEQVKLIKDDLGYVREEINS